MNLDAIKPLKDAELIDSIKPAKSTKLAAYSEATNAKNGSLPWCVLSITAAQSVGECRIFDAAIVCRETVGKCTEREKAREDGIRFFAT